MRRFTTITCLVVVLLSISLAAFATGRGHTPVTICHKGQTITVDDDAVDKHIELHGDYIGECIVETTTTTIVEDTTTTSVEESTTTSVQEEESTTTSTIQEEQTTTTTVEEETTTTEDKCATPCGWPFDDPDYNQCTQLFADECYTSTTYYERGPTTTVCHEDMPCWDCNIHGNKVCSGDEVLPFTGVNYPFWISVALAMMLCGGFIVRKVRTNN